MERRQLRRTVAQQMEAHVLSLNFDLGPNASDEDRAEATRQKTFVLEPLLKKLRRAQGHGKQTGHIVASVLAPKVSAPVVVTEKIDEATAEAFLEESMSGR